MGRKGTTKNRGRKDIFDRFYTQPTEAARLVRHLITSLWGSPLYNDSNESFDNPSLLALIPEDTVFVEPSAGDGAFVKALEDIGVPSDRIVAADIAPSEHRLCRTPIIACDYLDTGGAAVSAAETTIGNSGDADNSDQTTMKRFEDIVRNKFVGRELDPASTVIIGNPPFGEQGALCLSFLYRSFSLANTVAFILPPSFAKESLKRRVGRSIIAEYDIVDDSYRVHNDMRVVPSSFFIYDATKPYRPRASRISELPFIFLRNGSNDLPAADFTIRRVGGSAGHASIDMEVSTQSNYFCRVKRDEMNDPIIPVDALIGRINALDFPMRDKTVGPRSLSRDEIAWTFMDNYGDTDETQNTVN